MKKTKLIIDLSQKKIWNGQKQTIVDAILCAIQTTLPLRSVIDNKLCLISVRMTDDKEIQEINRKFRNKNKPTNVLSFQNVDWNNFSMQPMLAEQLCHSKNTAVYEITENLFRKKKSLDMDRKETVLNIGDIMLGYETIASEAKNFGKDFSNHLRFITIHGVLHLMGYDHQTEDEAGEMLALEALAMIKQVST